MTPNKSKLVFAVHTVLGAAYPALVNAVDTTAGGTTELLAGVIKTRPPSRPLSTSLRSSAATTGTRGRRGPIPPPVWSPRPTRDSGSGGIPPRRTCRVRPPDCATLQRRRGPRRLHLVHPDQRQSRRRLPEHLRRWHGGRTHGWHRLRPLPRSRPRFRHNHRAFPTLNTTPASLYFEHTFGGGSFDIFIATFNGDLTTKDYATYIGGAMTTTTSATRACSVGMGHVITATATDQVYLATTRPLDGLPQHHHRRVRPREGQATKRQPRTTTSTLFSRSTSTSSTTATRP